MPYRQIYEPAPSDMSMAVLTDEQLPQGVHPKDDFIIGSREAYGTTPDGEFKTYHHCSRCGGWVEGHASEYEVSTLNTRRLSGRRGTEYHCRRCGRQIAFHGIMS